MSTITITITAEQLADGYDQGSIIILTGTDSDGALVTFGADRRPTVTLMEAVEAEGAADAEVEEWQILARVPLRKATVGRRNGTPSVQEVTAYLPHGYTVTGYTPDTITIAGHDRVGWTLDGYVIPRLQSGLIAAKEVAND